MAVGAEMERTVTAVDVGERPSTGTRGQRHHDKGLVLIGGFKLVEAVFFVAVGMGALHFLHSDLGDAALKLATRLRMDPEGRLVSYVLDHVDALTAHRLRQIGIVVFLYAAVRVTEGVGLLMEKLWAEYLTVGVTAAFLPWEMYEIVKRADLVRIGLFVINVAVLIYLIWSLKRRERLGQV